MSKARNLNDPQHWKAWIAACARDEWSAKRMDLPGGIDARGRPRGFAWLTGQDTRALGAIAHCWALYARSDEAGTRGGLEAIRALLPAIQLQCRGFARELIPQAFDWQTRERLWPLVAIDPLDVGERMDGWELEGTPEIETDVSKWQNVSGVPVWPLHGPR